MKLEFYNETTASLTQDTFSPLVERGVDCIQADLANYQLPTNPHLTLTLVDNPTIQELNKLHRGKDYPTDVLTFSYLEGEQIPGDENDTVGEIIISIEKAQQQADERNHSLEAELQFLFTHGFLHVFGYDHQTDEEEAEMDAKTEEILQRK